MKHIPPFKAIVDNNRDWVSWRAPDGELVYVSPSCQRISGYSPEEFLRNPGLLGEIIHPEDRAEVHARLEEEIRSAVELPPLQFRISRKDGSQLWVSHTCRPVYDVGGGLLGHRLANRDISARMAAEEDSRKARDELERKVQERTATLRRTNRLLLMISACSQALVMIDDEKELVQAICQLILDEGGYRMAWVGYAEQDEARTVRPVASAGFEDGYLSRTVISWADTENGRGPTGTSIRERRVCLGLDFLTQPELAPWRDEALRRGYRSSIALPLIAESRSFGALTIYAERPGAFDQGQVPLLQGLAGDLAVGIMSVRARAQRDIARKALEQKSVQLKSLAAELVLTEERERRRIGQVLHDQLQQLIAGARFALESLRGAESGPALQEAVGRVDAMLGECLDVSRSLTTELSPPVHYGGDMESVVRWLADWSLERFQLSVEVEAEGRVAVESEEIGLLLFRSVRELLFNVVKHAGVRVARVSLGMEDDDRVRIVVRDQGAGFDPGQIRLMGGTEGGFGIFSIQERLEQLGGCLSIESAPGRGSSFTLWAPSTLKEAAVPAAAGGETAGADAGASAGSEPREQPVSGGRKIRVLLADDHEVVRQGLAMVLAREQDIEVIGEASDGQSAVELARRLLPDVVTMDINMPVLSGIEATRVLHDELPGIRVIGLSMFGEAEEGRALLEAGAVDFLSKAGASTRLLTAIRSACHNSAT